MLLVRVQHCYIFEVFLLHGITFHMARVQINFLDLLKMTDVIVVVIVHDEIFVERLETGD